jgi:hypothetical protein
MGCLLRAQQPLQVAGYKDPNGPPQTGWGQAITEPLARLQYGETANETTLVFVHTTVDASIAGSNVARGLVTTYQFLAPPIASWTGAAAPIAALNVVVTNPTAALAIPPTRVARHLAQFLAEPAPTPVYGTSSTNGLVAFSPLPWPTTLPRHDERKAWANALWERDETQTLWFFDVVRAGREALFQAAHAYVLGSSIVLDDAALDALAGLCEQRLGFEIYVQAAHVDRSASPARVRFSQRAVMRRLSLFESNPDPWYSIMGPHRWFPSLVHPPESPASVYVAGLGEQMHVLFPHAVENLRAWVTTASGLQEVWQIPNPIVNGNRLHPEIGVFAFPANALPGFVYFDHNMQLVVPVGAQNSAALVVPFDPFFVYPYLL